MNTTTSVSAQPTLQPGTRALVIHYTINVLVAAFWTTYAFENLERYLTWGSTLDLATLGRNTVLTLLFLSRRPARLTSDSPKEWTIAIVGTFVGYLFLAQGSVALVSEEVGVGIMMFAVILGTIGISALGRSFGIVPANRGIKTWGPYRIVRHPIYFSYVVFDLGYLLIAFSFTNLIVLLAFIGFCYLRASYEERILRQDPEYQRYAERTRSMFIPGVL